MCCRPSASLGSVIAVICVGLILLVYGEAEFNLAGFIIVMTASALSGLRWTITQVLLQGSSAHGVGDAPQLVMCSANCTRNVYADTSLSSFLASMQLEKEVLYITVVQLFIDTKHTL